MHAEVANARQFRSLMCTRIVASVSVRVTRSGVSGNRVACQQGTSEANDRQVDEFPGVVDHHAAAIAGGLLERLDDGTSILEFFLGGGESLVDHCYLAGVDERARRKALPQQQRGRGLKGFNVMDVSGA